MDPETALGLVKHGATLLLLDVPQYTLVGIDTQVTKKLLQFFWLFRKTQRVGMRGCFSGRNSGSGRTRSGSIPHSPLLVVNVLLTPPARGGTLVLAPCIAALGSLTDSGALSSGWTRFRFESSLIAPLIGAS